MKLLFSGADPNKVKSERNVKATAANHYILCLDESGSMRDDYKWDHLVEAYKHFLELGCKRVEDSVSVIQFDDRARVVIDHQSVSHVKADGLVMNGGATKYVPPLEAAKSLVAKTPVGVKPIIIFMTDGKTDDEEAAARYFKEQIVPLRNGKEPVELQGIFFGNADQTHLRNFCMKVNGSMKVASSGGELKDAFGSIVSRQLSGLQLFQQVPACYFFIV